MLKFRGNIKEILEKDSQFELLDILDQSIEVDSIQYGLNNYGGVTYIEGKYICSYTEWMDIPWFTNNKINLLIPDNIKAYDINDLLGFMGYPSTVNNGVGYWLNSEGVEIKDYHTIVSFTTSNIEALRLILRKVSMVGAELNQYCMGVYINDCFIMIK